MERPSVYCQNCRSQNSLRETHCQNCGTRLLLVVFPQSLQYDTNHVPSYYEDHLLERVSFLELRLVQLGEGLKIAMEIVREQNNLIRENHKHIKMLADKIGNQSGKKSAKNKPAAKTSNPIEIIVAEHDSPNVGLFTKLLEESRKLLEKSEEKEAFRMLERAVLLSPRNISLLVFTAREYFFADRFSDARKHLEKAFELAPDNSQVLLFLGVICADEGAGDKARLFLSILAEHEKTARLVNYVWGMLAAFEENWTESVAAFKVASETEENAELQYLIGCALFQQQDDAAALRHFQNAVSLDRQYADAQFMQAVIYGRQADERAEEILKNAAKMKEAGAQCTEFLRKNKSNLEIALPFQHFKKKSARLLTNGALRLARFLKTEINRAIE